MARSLSHFDLTNNNKICIKCTARLSKLQTFLRAESKNRFKKHLLDELAICEFSVKRFINFILHVAYSQNIVRSILCVYKTARVCVAKISAMRLALERCDTHTCRGGPTYT